MGRNPKEDKTPMKPFPEFAIFSVFMFCIVGCMHERRACFVSVEGGIKPIVTRNRYTLVDAKHKAETANVDLMAGNTFGMRFTNEGLRKFQPNVFSDDGIRVMLDYKLLNRTSGSSLGTVPFVFTLGVLPLFSHWETKSRCTLDVLDNPDARMSFERHDVADSAMTMFLPLSFLFLNGEADVPDAMANYSGHQMHTRSCYMIDGADIDMVCLRSEETLAYAIAALLKKMEDNGLITETNNKHTERNETLQNSVSDKYEIVEFEKDDDCAYRYSFALKRRDSGSVAVRESRELKKILRAMIREDYLLSFPDAARSVVIDFPKFSLQNGKVVGKAVALTFSVASLQYDPHRRAGALRIRIGENQFEEARKYARKNIESIARDKNIALDANKIPPSAVFYLEEEKLNGGMLEISFRVE